MAFRSAQELRPDLRSFQGIFCIESSDISVLKVVFISQPLNTSSLISGWILGSWSLSTGLCCVSERNHIITSPTLLELLRQMFSGWISGIVTICFFAGLVRAYLALSKTKEALFAAREAMRAMPQSAKALKLVGDVHASNSGHRDKVLQMYNANLFATLIDGYSSLFIFLFNRLENFMNLHFVWNLATLVLLYR